MKNINHLGILTTKKNAFFLVTLLVTLIIWATGTNHGLFLVINSQHGLLPVSVWDALNTIANPWFIGRLPALPTALVVLTLCFRREKLLNVILLIIAYYITFDLVKIFFPESRPFVQFNPDTFFWVPLADSKVTALLANRSFPSGHAGSAAIFVFASIHLFASNKIGLQVLLLTFLLLVMLARICTGWHFPLDVLASVLISFILTELCWPIPPIHQKRT